MIQTTSRNKKKAFSTAAAVLLGAASVYGLQSCGGGGSGTPAVSVTIAGGSVIEGDTGTQSITFTVTASAAVGGNATVNYATSDGTAVASADYTATSGTLTLPAGATSATVTVDVASDTDFEFDETFAVTLSSPAGVALGATASANGTITNDDDASPSGYFTGSGTVNGINVSDFTGLANAGRLLMFSPGTNLLYDIDLGTVTVTDFSAAGGSSVDVYVSGSNTETVTVTGTTNESQIQGSFAGGTNANSNVTFDLLFDTQNNRGAALARIEAIGGLRWAGDMYGFVSETGVLSSDATGHYVGLDTTAPSCGHVGDFVNLDASVNIYPMAHDLVQASSCGFLPSAGHTGFASVIDNVDPDDKLVYAFTNGTLALFAVMNRP